MEKTVIKTLTQEQARSSAKELQKFLNDNGLVINIAGKNYVPVEGWQFIGSNNGLTQIVVSCEPEETKEKEVKYKAIVEIVNTHGNVVSRGFAWCSNKEFKKRSFDEFAVASMAQTRAIGKAYRNILSWIVRLGGYEPTPAEEINRENAEEELSKAKQNIVAKMHENGITDSLDMMGVIQNAIGKDMVENIDEADKVIKHLEKDNE